MVWDPERASGEWHLPIWPTPNVTVGRPRAALSPLAWHGSHPLVSWNLPFNYRVYR